MGNLSQTQQIGLANAGLGAVNSAVSGLGQYESGQQKKKAYEYDAAVTLEETRQKAQTTEAKYSNLIGRQASDYAAAGIDISSGSALLMMAHTASQGGVETASEVEAGNEQAALDRYYGKVAAFQGTVGGISTFLSGLSKAGLQAAGIMGSGSKGTIPTSSGQDFSGWQD